MGNLPRAPSERGPHTENRLNYIYNSSIKISPEMELVAVPSMDLKFQTFHGEYIPAPVPQRIKPLAWRVKRDALGVKFCLGP